MRIAVIVLPARKNPAPPYARALVKGMEAMGHRVYLVDGYTGDGRSLAGYEYLAVLAEPVSFLSGKIPQAAALLLSNAGGLSGKKGAAFIKKNGLFGGSSLSRLMALMEKEGIVVNWSDFVLGSAQAEALGRRIGA
jgi:hypothetical protein